MIIKEYQEFKPVQRALGLKADGLPGPKTLAAVALRLRCHEIWSAVQAAVNVTPDGIPGPKTAAAIAAALGIEMPRRWPTQSEVWSGNSIFGKAGSGLVTVNLPYLLRLAWEPETTVRRLTCHEAVAESLLRIFQRTLDHYGLACIQALGLDLFGGCYNERKISGGSKPSMHSWGIAVDVDPDHNGLKVHKPQARLSGTDYDAFWEFVEAEGGVSLGRERDYDWMHFQFARL